MVTTRVKESAAMMLLQMLYGRGVADAMPRRRNEKAKAARMDPAKSLEADRQTLFAGS